MAPFYDIEWGEWLDSKECLELRNEIGIKEGVK